MKISLQLKTKEITKYVTFWAFSPHPQVNGWDITAMSEVNWVVILKEEIFWDLLDVIGIVTDNSSQGNLLDLSQLTRFKGAWVFIPKSREESTQINA